MCDCLEPCSIVSDVQMRIHCIVLNRLDSIDQHFGYTKVVTLLAIATAVEGVVCVNID